VGKDKVNMTVEYKGSKLFYTVTGAGPACILLHGFLENATIWDVLRRQLKSSHKVICIDLPGHGQSDVLDGTQRIADMADAVLQVVEREKLGKVDIVGHSMGGYVALAFAKANLEKVTGVLLLNSTPVADDQQRVANRKHGIAMAQKNYEAIVKMSIANLFATNNRKKLEKEIEKLKEEALKTPIGGYIAGQVAMMNRPDLSNFFREATFKKAMLLGENDTLIEAFETKKAFIAKIPEITILSGGHVLFLENPKKTYTIIEDFLNKDKS